MTTHDSNGEGLKDNNLVNNSLRLTVSAGRTLHQVQGYLQQENQASKERANRSNQPWRASNMSPIWGHLTGGIF